MVLRKLTIIRWSFRRWNYRKTFNIFQKASLLQLW